MPDQKPPRLYGDERATLTSLLQFQRESLVRKASGVDEAAARASPVGSGTTLLWLMKHMAAAECRWILERFAAIDDAVPSEVVTAGDSMEAAVAGYRESWAKVDAVVEAAPSLDEVCRRPTDEAPVNLRWVLMHLLEETARHAGHADILRELIDGRTGR